MSLIRSYGLFYQVENIFWGKQRSPGSILGRKSGSAIAEPTDFRSQQGIYVLYAEYDMVYVGQVGNRELITRLKEHFSDELAGRWDRFSWFGTRWVTDTENKLAVGKNAVNTPMASAIDHLEAILIQAAEPRLNRKGGSWGKKAQQYIQVRDPRLGPTEQEMVHQIHEKMKTWE